MSGPTFCYNIGYAGYAKFQDYIMLATDGSFQLTHNHMLTTGVYGGAIDNATSAIAFAPDYPTTTANIGFQLTSGSDFFVDLGNSISLNRIYWHKVTIYPNGVAGYSSQMYTQSLQYSASQDSIVTGSVSFKGSDINSVVTDEDADFTNADHKNGVGSEYIDTLTPNYNSVYPYYGTEWTFANTAKGVVEGSQFQYQNLSKDIISWSITASQQINFVKLCDGNYYQIDQLKADYAILGLMQVNGNAQLIGINQRFQEGCMFYYIDGQSTLTMKSADGYQSTITIPNMQCSDISSQLQTGTSLVTTSFNFIVVGNKDNNSLISFE